MRTFVRLTPQFIRSKVTVEEIDNGAKFTIFHDTDFTDDQLLARLFRPEHSFDGDLRVRFRIDGEVNVACGPVNDVRNERYACCRIGLLRAPTLNRASS